MHSRKCISCRPPPRLRSPPGRLPLPSVGSLQSAGDTQPLPRACPVRSLLDLAAKLKPNVKSYIVVRLALSFDFDVSLRHAVSIPSFIKWGHTSVEMSFGFRVRFSFGGKMQCVCMYVCVCVCERERAREPEISTGSMISGMKLSSPTGLHFICNRSVMSSPERQSIHVNTKGES